MEPIPVILVWGTALLLGGCSSYDAQTNPSPDADTDESTVSANLAFSVFETAAESRSRRTRELSDALRQSLRQLPGIADARVHLSLEDTSILSKSPRKSGAAVLIVPRNRMSPSISIIRDFTMAAVPGLSQDTVHVFIGAPRTQPEKLVSVGMFQVAEHSASALKATLAGLLILCLLTAFALIAAGIRIRKLRGPP